MNPTKVNNFLKSFMQISYCSFSIHMFPRGMSCFFRLHTHFSDIHLWSAYCMPNSVLGCPSSMGYWLHKTLHNHCKHFHGIEERLSHIILSPFSWRYFWRGKYLYETNPKAFHFGQSTITRFFFFFAWETCFLVVKSNLWPATVFVWGLLTVSLDYMPGPASHDRADIPTLFSTLQDWQRRE